MDCEPSANAGGPYSQASLLPLRCQRLDESHTWVSEILKGPRRKRLGVIGIGVLGDPARVSELIAYMQIEQLSRVAGESFTMITGADLKYLDLDRPKPEAEAGPTEDPNDANIAMDEDEAPWPCRIASTTGGTSITTNSSQAFDIWQASRSNPQPWSIF